MGPLYEILESIKTGVSAMKYWVQFQNHPLQAPGFSQYDTSQLIDACGDRSVFILDGRNSERTMQLDALKRAQTLEHHTRFAAFCLCKGESLARELKRSTSTRLSYPVQV